MTVRLHALVVGDDPAAWRDAGFAVEGSLLAVGEVRVICRDDGGGADRWILAADDQPLPDTVDGIATSTAPSEDGPAVPVVHPNGIDGFDHVVVRSPDLDRTTEAFESIGLECRRIRDASIGEQDVQQRFFRAGPAILELVGAPEPTGDGPATIWGYAVVAPDIDATARFLGDRIGSVRDAVQPGRRIATLRTRELGISVPVAVMSPHVR